MILSSKMEMEYGEAAANELLLNNWARDTKCWTDKALLQFLAENQAAFFKSSGWAVDGLEFAGDSRRRQQ